MIRARLSKLMNCLNRLGYDIESTVDKSLPFEPLAPNAETVAAMKAARRGELVTVSDADALLASLNENG